MVARADEAHPAETPEHVPKITEGSKKAVILGGRMAEDLLQMNHEDFSELLRMELNNAKAILAAEHSVSCFTHADDD